MVRVMRGVQTGAVSLQGAVETAVNAAVDSYAPYSRCPAGMALVTNSGHVYGGGVIESCAYNPTLNPLQSAYIAFAAAGEADFSQARSLLRGMKTAEYVFSSSTHILLLQKWHVRACRSVPCTQAMRESCHLSTKVEYALLRLMHLKRDECSEGFQLTKAA